MFNNDIRVESVPARVFELCKLVESTAGSTMEIREKLTPSTFSNNGTQYFTYIKDAAIELKLIEEVDRVLSFIGDKNAIKNIDAFRFYCNSVVWKNADTRFYKLATVFLNSNDKWLKYKSFSTSPEVLGEVREKTGDDGFQPTHLLGERFWLSFLGFGFIQSSSNSFVFLPNMYIALKDFIVMANIEKEKEISIVDFVEKINSFASVALKDIFKTKEFNLAMSNALRQLHDNKEIILKRNNDSKDIWYLNSMESHPIRREISHLVLKGVK